jgi:hypothetical protein
MYTYVFRRSWTARGLVVGVTQVTFDVERAPTKGIKEERIPDVRSEKTTVKNENDSIPS